MATPHDYASTRREIVTGLPEYFNMLVGMGSPELAAAGRMGSLAGARMGQDVQAALGGIGAGSTGVGALTRGLAGTFGAQFQSQARLSWLQKAMEGALNLQIGSLEAGSRAGKKKSGWEEALDRMQGGASAASQFFGG